MATITKTNAGTFKAIIRRNNRTLKTKTFKLKKHAREWAKKIEGDADLIKLYGSEGALVTFNQLADQYEAWWSPSHNTKGLSFRLGFWCDLYGDTRIIDIDPSSIRAALKAYGQNRAPASVNRMRACLSSVFKYAVKERDYLDNNPVKRVSSLTEDNKIVRYLSDKDRTALVDACKASDWDKLYLLVLLALTTGARLSEMMGLHWNDIDFNARTAILHTTKNGESRTLTFPPVAMNVLQCFREVGAGLVFPSPTKWRKPFEFRKHWVKALNQAGIENFRFHDLRHSAASMLVMSGATLHEAGVVLGHKSVHTTQRYAHLSTEHQQKLTDRVLGNLEGLK